MTINSNYLIEIGHIIDSTNMLEDCMKEIIQLYIMPINSVNDFKSLKFVQNQLVHNTIMPFSSKVKLIKEIARLLDHKFKNFEKNIEAVMSCRNAFAHSSYGKSSFKKDVKKQNMMTYEASNSESAFLKCVTKVSGSGNFALTSRRKAWDDYQKAWKISNQELNSLLHTVLTRSLKMNGVVTR